MKKINRKGFTLIELLAVIVILGILMLTAIPAVTRAIAKSRRNTFWQNAKQYVQAAQTPFLAGEYYKSGTSDTCAIPSPSDNAQTNPSANAVKIDLEQVDLDGGSIDKSAFGVGYISSGNCKPAIYVVNEGVAANPTNDTEGRDKLVWYFVGVDTSGNGIKTATQESKLSLAKVQTGLGSSPTCTLPTTIKGTVQECKKESN